MSVQAKRWTRAEYERMVELGLLAPDSHVQLIDGEILEMPPQGAPHSATIGVIYEALRTIFKEKPFHVRSQMPLLVSDYSEPEPDLAVVRGQIRDYMRAHPAATDVVLAVEIAGSTIDLDRRRKAKIYAQAGIPEYWIVAIQERVLEVFTGPGAAGYERRVTLQAGDTVSPTAKPDTQIAVASLLP
jgi:Uma2 family endonuclease